MIRTRASGALSGRAFVSLTEALTWIAFADAMTHDQLLHQVAGHTATDTRSAKSRLRSFFAGEEEVAAVVNGLGHFENREQGLAILADAWHRLRDLVDCGALVVRGRYTRSYTAAEATIADTIDLSGNQLASFSQFDISTGGIRRQSDGSPSVLWPDHHASFDREFEALSSEPSLAEGYLLVEVELDGLLNAIQAPEVIEKPNVVTATIGAETECRKWLIGEFASDPDKKRTKSDFQSAALERFLGRLSVRGFIRAWDAVARDAGRSRAGRKS